MTREKRPIEAPIKSVLTAQPGLTVNVLARLIGRRPEDTAAAISRMLAKGAVEVAGARGWDTQKVTLSSGVKIKKQTPGRDWFEGWGNAPRLGLSPHAGTTVHHSTNRY